MLIANKLSLSIKTVQNYVSSILTRLQVADRAQAIVRAREAALERKNCDELQTSQTPALSWRGRGYDQGWQ